MPGEEDMSNDQEIAVAMAVHDIMSAIVTLRAMPAETVRQEFLDLERVEEQLHSLMDNIYDRDTVRELRQRAYGNEKAVVHAMAMREIS